jgi:hypothetical protein
MDGYSVRQGLIHDNPPYRVWRVILPAPHALWSANDTHRKGRFDVSAARKAWRHASYNAVRAAGIPQGLPRVSLSLVWHFTDDGRRDSLNYADTAKPIIDGMAAPFIQKPTIKKPSGAYAPGALIIADDTDAYVEDTNLKIGPLWQDVITADGYTLTLADLTALDNEWGGVTIVIGERPALPPQPKRKRVPLKNVIDPDTRRRLALGAFLG